MQNTLIDNSSEELKLSTILKQCFINPNINEIKIATGYWDLPGMVLIYDELKSFLEREDTIFQLLIGKDPRIAVSQQEKIKIKDPSYPKDFIKTDIQNLELKSEYQKIVKLLLNYCTDDENSKIQVRVFRKNENEETQFLHSKCYIFNGKDVSIGIIGSSNFTQKGLEGNSELNYLKTTRQIVKYPVEGNLKGHIGWFNEKWEISEVWNQTFEEILKESPLAPPPTNPTISELTTPYQVYIKFLQSQWGDMLDSKNTSMLENFLPQEVQKLQYQLDAVNQGYSILKRHGGFILADVVGLGKTMVGVLTIKRFLEDINREGREKNVLIITPPAIKTSWENTIELFNDNSFSSHIQIVTIGSIGKLVDSQENEEELEEIENEELNISGLDKNFGLILIDESHKFRNSETQMYKALDNLIENISPQPYVVLLSATPQNNTPSDLKNQIYLFQRERHNTTLDRILGRNLSAFFSKIESQYEQLKKDPKANNDELIALSRKVRACVLDDLLVRRTRTDIKKYYQTDANGIKFPQVKGPNLLKYEMSDELVQLFLDTMEKIAPFSTIKNEIVFEEGSLNYYRYRAIEYLVNQEDRNQYKNRNLNVENISRRLARIMQILLVKRLESSFSAFKQSLRNLQQYTENMIMMLKDDVVFICPDIDVNAELNTELKSKKYGKKVTKEDCYNDIRKKIKQKGGKNKEFRTADFSEKYIVDLQEDKEIIDRLCKRWDRFNDDPKLDIFTREIYQTLFNKEINNPNGYDKPKLVIFTEALATLQELKKKIEGRTKYKVLAISAENRKEKETIIRENFDANYPKELQKDDYDIIITTEVLAEGVNLHRSNVIVNYDTPWNSTRLMQRIGRVNRIGSKEDFVYIFNFMPTAQSDAQINLVQKAHTKLQAFHAMFGEDNKIFTDAEELVNYDKDPKALQKLVDGEESPYEKYISQLRTLKKENPELYTEIENLEFPLQSASPNNADGLVCWVSSKGGKNLYMNVKNDEVQKLNTIEMIEKLQCEPDTPALKIPQDFENLYQKAINEYLSFFDKMITSKDSNKNRTEAIGILKKMLNKTQMAEVKETLKIANTMVRNGNNALAKKIIQLSKKMENEITLFNVNEDDFNEVILREFSDLKKRSKDNKDTCLPQIILSNINVR